MDNIFIDPNVPLPWERQPNEPYNSFLVFCEIRDSPPGSTRMDQLAEKYKKNVQTLYRWAKAWRWQARVSAYCDYQDEKKRLEKDIVRQEMLERHARLAKKAIELCEIKMNTIDVDAMSPRDLATLFDLATKIELRSRGEPTEHVKQTHSGTVQHNMEVTNVGQKVVNDPAAADLACRLLERLTTSTSDTSGIRPLCITGEMEDGEASSPVEPEASGSSSGPDEEIIS